MILNTGQSEIFDFDLSGASPPPPYDLVGVVLSFGAGDLIVTGESIRIDVRDFDLGPIIGSFSVIGVGAGTAVSTAVPLILPDLNDGMGLLELTMVSGSVDLTRVQVDLRESSGSGFTPRVDAVHREVPEPGSLAMLVIGLAWLAYLGRRRKRHAPI